MKSTKKASEIPEIWLLTKPGLKWIDDRKMIDTLQMFFYNWEVVYQNRKYMANLLKDHANKWRDYYNKLYDTTMYDYNPMWNTDAKTVTEVIDEEKTKAKSDGSGSSYDIAYDANTAKETDRTKTGATSSGDRTFKHTETVTRTGNIGVTSSAQLIQGERDVLINVTQQYIDSFKPFFNLDSELKKVKGVYELEF